MALFLFLVPGEIDDGMDWRKDRGWYARGSTDRDARIPLQPAVSYANSLLRRLQANR
jgi:hypothetical protein